MSQSRTIEVTIPCEVFYEEIVDKSYGEDADGNRGTRVVEYVPETALVLTRVPKAVEEWATTEAIDKFNRTYNE